MSLGDRARVNHELRKLGFGSLDDPNLIPQIAFFIRSHEQFRSQLFSVKPEQRSHAYNALRPHLRFQAKPLDVYEAEMRQMAENQKLPIWDGSAYPKPFEETRLTELAEDAIKQHAHEAKGFLELVCSTCTKQGIFRAKIRKDAEKEAQSEGWRWAEKNGQMKTYCPQHVPGRCKVIARCSKCPRQDTYWAWNEQDCYAKLRLAAWTIGESAVCPDCSMPELVIH